MMKWAASVIIIVVSLIWFNLEKDTNWVTISYGGLIDRSILTHNGETVGQVIQKIPTHTADLKGLVQQYLEPYSLLCHDVLLSIVGPDTPPLVNILAHYPIGSEQPAWVDLFREGHFQLYYNAHLIRIFIKGSNPKHSFEKYYSIIRHSIQDVINSAHTSINNLEVYVFNNNYANAKLDLDTIPHVYKIADLDLSPKRKSIDLKSIEDLLKQSVVLEAAEVDANNDLFFYGRKASIQTLAGHPVSLSDIAVVYRSVFHHGNNAPYISLDKNEDNRYAKVNFGGHLENTRVGYVVLEADKLFKLLSTGIDPNTHKQMKFKITKHVPTFLTQDERGFLEGNNSKGYTQIRYWFYPDSIGTVTDGSIGAVSNNQFLADAERMDTKKVNISNATKKTIDHLNQNFSQYERAENIFKELSTVGRIMALVIWLKKMNMDNRIELDDLLSVNIPTFKTQKRTKKMLATSVLAVPGISNLTSRYVRDYTKTYDISHLLDQYNASTSDKEYVEVGKKFASNIDDSKLAPAQYSKALSEKNYYRRLIESNEPKIKSLKNEIDRKSITINKYDSREVDQYNNLVNEYNRSLATHKSYINNFNSKTKELNDMKISITSFASIGGGINLRPSQFKPISKNITSPKLLEVIEVKNKIKVTGGNSKSESWVRSNPGTGVPRINKLPVSSWESSKSVNGKIVHSFQTNSADVASVTISPNSREWQSEISINGSQDMVKYSQNENLLKVQHAGFTNLYIGKVSSNGKNFVFHQ